MAATMIQRQRAATPERWANAFARATEYGAVAVRVAADRWAVQSTNRNVTYLVTVDANGMQCSCPAGQAGDPCCYHCGAIFLQIERETPEPPPAAPAVAVAGCCPECGGLGYHRKVSATFGTTYRINCPACRGKGGKRAA